MSDQPSTSTRVFVRPAKRRDTSQSWFRSFSRNYINGYFFFLLPAVIIVLSLTLFPAVYGIYISFTNLNLGYEGSRFVGLENYVRLFAWVDLPVIARNTVAFVSCVVLLQVTAGLAVALILNIDVPGKKFMRSLSILPWVVPAIVSALVFSQIFGGSRLGIANYLLSLVGVRQHAWFADPILAMAVLIFVAAWRGMPFTASIILGGLQTLPKDAYEAAIIDGANRWQRFRYITLPLLRPMLLINLIMATAAALNSLDIPLALTGGGPGKATELLSISLYRQAFLSLDASYGATIGTIMLAINVVLIVLYLQVLKSNKGQL